MRSIIILDEVQTLPVEFLKPCLAVLRELAADYQCTIVLCTATQPAFDYRDDFKIGLKGIRPIMPVDDTITLYETMRRTQVVDLGTLTNTDLVAQLQAEAQVLCIVNTRKHAVQLYDLLRGDGEPDAVDSLFHLSTWMCAAHRSQTLLDIKQRLKDRRPCRVVSTSLIEAGVDIDFPTVYRALAGVDAIAQAAGRCNREGRSPLRTVFTFDPAEAGASHFVNGTIASTREVSPDFPDLLCLDAIRRYFVLHFWQHVNRSDEKKIMDCFSHHNRFEYRRAAKLISLIEDRERPIIVPWGDRGQELVAALNAAPPAEIWRFVRKLQRFTVGVAYSTFDKMLGNDIRLVREAEFGDRFPILNMKRYDAVRGLATT